jgi:transcription elongation factor GreA
MLSLKIQKRGEIMPNKNTVYLTEEGLQELQSELDNLINVKRPANIEAIKEARSFGDLSENSEYDAARNEQAQIESRIKEVEKMLENVSIIKDISTDKVSIGNTVKVKYVGDDDEDEYKIVGSQEADPFEGKISNESPIAAALLNHKLGDTVTVDSPNGTYDIEITAIS